MERCAICDCQLTRGADYATPTPNGRAHASKHHFVPERFFGRSANRRGEVRQPVFAAPPWGHEGECGLFCYDCHEDLLHNPVLLPTQIKVLAKLVKLRRLDEDEKTDSREKLAGRIRLLQEAIALGLETLAVQECGQQGPALRENTAQDA